MNDYQELITVIETWAARRHEFTQFTRVAMNDFAAVMNANSRRLVSMLGVQDPEFYSALAELATNAGTLTTRNARLIADGVDVTKL